MNSSLRTLVLGANGYGLPPVIIDTTLQGILRIPQQAALPFGLDRFYLLRMLVGQRYEHLSYVRDWEDAICQAPELVVDRCNVNNRIDLRRRLKDIREYDLVIVMHSAAGDSMSAIQAAAPRLDARRGKLVVFLGNECDQIGQRLAFLKCVNPEFVCTQLPRQTADWIYRDITDASLLEMPHALNPDVYQPDPSVERVFDLGFVGALYHLLIGDEERTRLIKFFEEQGSTYGLSCDIRLRLGDVFTKQRNLIRQEWALFLNSCHGLLGAESGPYYIDEGGKLRAEIRRYLQRHPGSTFEDIHARFYKDKHSPVSGKTISSRHFEPIGTRTCQILIEGRYNDILQPEKHYISVKKDLSDIENAIERFKDQTYRTAIADQAYADVMDRHTYRHRVATLIQAVS